MGKFLGLGCRIPMLAAVRRFLNSPAFMRGIVSSAIVGAIALSFSALQCSSAAADGINPVAPTLTTTVTAPMNPTVGNSWNDAATVTGNAAGGAPTGSVAFTLCEETAPSTPCSGGTPVGTVTAPTSVGDVSTFTLPTADAQTPTSPGTYCYNASYTATSGGYYSSVWQQSDTECFTVCPAKATPTLTTTVTAPMNPTVGNSWNDAATVTGNAAGGAPTGSVAFTLCEETAPSTPCSGGTPVGTVTAPTSVGDVSTFTLPTADAQTPTSPGTYCYNASYTATSGGYYSSVWQQSDTECFTVCPAKATPTLTTTVTAPMNPTVGNSWNDAATVTGNAAGGAPTGSVAFTLCEETAPSTPCSGGTPVGTVTAPTSVGDVSTFTLPTADAQTPTSPGTYCYNASYTATSGGYYSSVWQQSDTECFSVIPALSATTTQQSTSASGSGSIVLGGSVTDTAVVTGNMTGGVPTGAVTFFECGPTASPALCTSGTQVGTAMTLGSPSGDTSSATSTSFTPTAAGTYCFAAVYSPDRSANYTSSNDNVSGSVQADECFVVTVVVTTAAPTTPTTTPPTTTLTTPPPSVTVPPLAFTGADVSDLVASGLGFIGLGGFLVLIPRRRIGKP